MQVCVWSQGTSLLLQGTRQRWKTPTGTVPRGQEGARSPSRQAASPAASPRYVEKHAGLSKSGSSSHALSIPAALTAAHAASLGLGGGGTLAVSFASSSKNSMDTFPWFDRDAA